MRFKYSIPFLLICLLPLLGAAQFTYEFKSDPDSAEVYLNGKLEGKTPCKVKFYWEGVSDSGMVFRIKHDNYKDDVVVVREKPRLIKTTQMVVLEKVRTHFDLDSASAMIEFDKLLAEFSTGKEIGEVKDYRSSTKLTWEGFSRLGSDPIGVKTYDVLGTTGFNTPMKESLQLFSTEKHKRKNARFLLGAKVTDLWITMQLLNAYTHLYDAQVRLSIEWQIFDRSTNQVVLRSTTSATEKHRFEGEPSDGVLIDAYADALSKFLANGKLYELVKSAGTTQVSDAPEPTEETASTMIVPAKMQKFETNPEMIQYSTQGCVTISTDAGHGSGVLISDDGYVLTAAHVIEGVNRINVIFSNGVELDAKVIGSNKTYDIALLDVAGSKYKALPLGVGLTMGLGEEVYTIGTPGDIELGQSVSKGIVSGKRKEQDILYIQTDVSVSPGNSGGPLIDGKGQVIGIIQRKLIGNGIEGVGFALPIETALKQLKVTVKE